jgi:hypothetical protein
LQIGSPVRARHGAEGVLQEMAACEAGRAGADDSDGGFCHGLLLL